MGTCTQSTLFGGAALAQAVGLDEDTTRCLENYTGLLAGLLKLVGTMANGYEDATEDIRSLVASTLDAATQWDRTFIAGASQALAQMDFYLSMGHEPGGTSVNTRSACSLGSGLGSRNCPIPPGNIPHYRTRKEYGVGRNIPNPYTSHVSNGYGPGPRPLSPS